MEIEQWFDNLKKSVEHNFDHIQRKLEVCEQDFTEKITNLADHKKQLQSQYDKQAEISSKVFLFCIIYCFVIISALISSVLSERYLFFDFMTYVTAVYLVISWIFVLQRYRRKILIIGVWLLVIIYALSIIAGSQLVESELEGSQNNPQIITNLVHGAFTCLVVSVQLLMYKKSINPHFKRIRILIAIILYILFIWLLYESTASTNYSGLAIIKQLTDFIKDHLSLIFNSYVLLYIGYTLIPKKSPAATENDKAK